MATTVTYKGQTLATVENQTKVLQTAGTWCEDDFTLTDVSGGGAGEWTSDGIATNAEPNGAITLGSIEVGAFALARKTTITSLSGSVTQVIENAFNGCRGLTSISFPNMTGQVQQSAARDCSNLVIADLGGCTQINNGAFQNDNILQTVILRRTSVCNLQNAGAFTNTAIRGYGGGSGTIYVPSALVETYKTATNWSSIYNEGHVTFSAIEGSIYEL